MFENLCVHGDGHSRLESGQIAGSCGESARYSCEGESRNPDESDQGSGKPKQSRYVLYEPFEAAAQQGEGEMRAD